MSSELNNGFSEIFPTTVLKRKVHITDDIIESTLQKEISDDVKDIFFNVFNEYLNTIIKKSIYNFSDYHIVPWINLYDNNKMNFHTHAGTQLSSVLYLSDCNEGSINFHDPRFYASRGYSLSYNNMFDTLKYSPKQGDIIVFPSFLYHDTDIVKGNKICIAADLITEEETFGQGSK